MTEDQIRSILEAYRTGSLGMEAALGSLSGLDSPDLGHAVLDTRRHARLGYPEAVYCAGKTPSQVRDIVSRFLGLTSPILATRATPEHWEACRDLSPLLVWNPVARTISARPLAPPPGSGFIALVSAGTSDQAVSEEAGVTAETLGCRVERFYDVGVAGIHRLFDRLDRIRQAEVAIVVAGMEGALVSVLGGLAGIPLVAVPTSVGYGANFGGIAALLAMLNSCAPGVGVVNIDNGFGAGYLAAMIAAKSRAHPGDQA